MSSLLILTFTVIWTILIAAVASMPLWNFPAVAFGISVSEEHRGTSEIVRLRTLYVRTAVAAGILLAAGSLLGFQADADNPEAVITVLLGAYLALGLLAYAVCRSRMKQFKADKGWHKREADAPRTVTVDTAFRDNLAPSVVLTLLPFLLILINTAAVILCYDRIPDMLILHYDISGQPDRTGPKSFANVFGPNLVQLFIAFLMLGVQEIIVKSKQQLVPSDPITSRNRNKAFRREGILLLQWLSLSVIIDLLLAQLSILDVVPAARIIPIAILLPFAPLIVYTIRMIRLGRRSDHLGSSGSAPAGEDDHWKWGLFYYNPDDKSLFVEKRAGLGWTINFGRPAGWAVLFVTLAFPVAIIILIETSTG